MVPFRKVLVVPYSRREVGGRFQRPVAVDVSGIVPVSLEDGCHDIIGQVVISGRAVGEEAKIQHYAAGLGLEVFEAFGPVGLVPRRQADAGLVVVIGHKLHLDGSGILPSPPESGPSLRLICQPSFIAESGIIDKAAFLRRPEYQPVPSVSAQIVGNHHPGEIHIIQREPLRNPRDTDIPMNIGASPREADHRCSLQGIIAETAENEHDGVGVLAAGHFLSLR